MLYSIFTFNFNFCLHPALSMSNIEEDDPMKYKAAADEGDVESMVIYAELLYKGKQVPMNKHESSQYFKKAADQGNLKAMLNYANMVGKGDGLPSDKKESAYYFKLAADKGEVNSMFYYAQILYRGDGIDVDKTEAARYFKMAADGGKRDAMHNYAMMLYRGDGIDEDKVEASIYFKKAADSGQPQSMYHYAMMLSKSEVNCEDTDQAKKYFKMAADRGQMQSMYHYAVLSSKSDDLDDKKEAASYFKMAANKGHVQSMCDYATMLSKGDIIPQNKDEAAYYFKQASDKGNTIAKNRFNELKNAGYLPRNTQPPNLSQSFKSPNKGPEIIRPDSTRSPRRYANKSKPQTASHTKSQSDRIHTNKSNDDNTEPKLPKIHPEKPPKTAQNQPKPPEKLQSLDGSKSPRNKNQQQQSQSSEKVSIFFDKTESGRFRGIIHFLTEKAGGNVHNKKVVKVTSSSVYTSRPLFPFLPFSFMNDDYNPYNCVDLDDIESCFESDLKPNSWVCYDFKDLKVQPNMYSIRTYIHGNNHLQSWVIEGSNNGSDWTLLDQRDEDRSLDGVGKSNSFTLKFKKDDQSFRFLRLRQTGPTTGGSTILNVSALEFFGSIIGTIKFDKKKKKSTLKSPSNSSLSSKQVEGLKEKPLKIHFKGTEEDRFKGIIHFLSEKCGGGNVHKEGLVDVTSSSVIPSLSFLISEGDEDFNPYNCVDLDNKESYFESGDEPDSWICYDFKNLKVKPNMYSIRSHTNSDNHLQTWVIEGSNDKENWTLLDKRRNERSLDGKGAMNTFKTTENKTKYFRYLRLKQTEGSTMSSNIISISALEFFGSVFEGEISSSSSYSFFSSGKSAESESLTDTTTSTSSSISSSLTDSEIIDLESVEEIEDPLDIQFDESTDGRFRGIIHHLSQKCNGENVHLEGLVDVTSSSVIPTSSNLFPFPFSVTEEDYNPYNCVDLDDEKTCFESANEPNSWICYDFRKLKVKPNKYSIRSYVNGNNHLKSWVIEGSNDKIKWTVLDKRENDTSLNETGRSNTFQMNTGENDVFYRYLRLRQTGKSTINSNVISISALEFFGSIVGKITKGPTRKRKGRRETHTNNSDNDPIPGPRPKKRRSKRHKHHKKRHHHHHHHRRHHLLSSSSSSSSLSDSSNSSYSSYSSSDYFSSRPVEGLSDEPFSIEYDGTEEGRFKGIIHFLSEKCGGGNVHKEGLVEVTSSSVIPSLSFLLSEGDEDYNPYNCVDLDNKESCFESSNEKNSWICYDFQNLKVRPNMYSIRTYVNGDNHLQSWVVEGSNDSVNWTILDERIKDKSLNDTGKSNTFKISMNLGDNEYYRCLRLRQTGSTTEGMNILNISALDYFGSLYCRISVV